MKLLLAFAAVLALAAVCFSQEYRSEVVDEGTVLATLPQAVTIPEKVLPAVTLTTLKIESLVAQNARIVVTLVTGWTEQEGEVTRFVQFSRQTFVIEGDAYRAIVSSSGKTEAAVIAHLLTANQIKFTR